ncbi:MAG: hypothetical protein ACLSDQ_08715 [Adlercreutzia equolifaciens]
MPLKQIEHGVGGMNGMHRDELPAVRQQGGITGLWDAVERRDLRAPARIGIARAGEVQPDLPIKRVAGASSQAFQLGVAHAPVGDPPRVRPAEGDIRRRAKMSSSCSYSVGSTVHESAPMPACAPSAATVAGAGANPTWQCIS